MIGWIKSFASCLLTDVYFLLHHYSVEGLVAADGWMVWVLLSYDTFPGRQTNWHNIA
jgi:hypothetical protein